MFRPIFPPAFFRCLLNSGTFMELRTISSIESMGVACSDSVSHNWVQVLSITALLRWLNLQPSDDCFLRSLREPTPITVTLCVLLDNSEWIFGTYKLNVLTWLGLLLLCMIFYLQSYSDLFFLRTIKELKLRYGNVKDCGLHFGMSSENGSHTRCTAVEMKPVNKQVRTTTENQKENSKSMSALSFSSWPVVSLCQANASNQVFIFCFLLLLVLVN